MSSSASIRRITCRALASSSIATVVFGTSISSAESTLNPPPSIATPTAASDTGAEDIEQDGDVFQVTSAPESLSSVREAIEAAGFTVESAELMVVPQTTVAVADEAKARQVMRLIDALEDNDDVQDVYANFDIPERVLEAVAG